MLVSTIGLARYLLFLLAGMLCAFLLGAIPVGVIVGKVFYGIDIREHGSGNTGATNIARTLGAGPGAAVLLLDTAKGALSVLAMMGSMHLAAHGLADTAWTVGPAYRSALPLAALCSILGHMFSPFLGFHGGKGAATACGGVSVIMPKVAVLCLVVFVLVGFCTRYISLGSMSAAVTLVIATHIFYGSHIPYLVFSWFVCIVIFIAHRSNIKRLLAHEENRFSFGHGQRVDHGHGGDDPAGKRPRRRR